MPRFVIKQDRQINGNRHTVFWLPFLDVFVFSSFHQLIEYADFFWLHYFMRWIHFGFINCGI